MASASFSSIPFSSLRFSKLYTDFIGNEGLTALRFPANQHLFTNATPLKNIASANKHRSQIQDAIRETMRGVQLSTAQTSNLAALAESTTLTVMTGQQVGFLGGALYTMLKAFSAVIAAQKLASTHTELKFVPVFWIEDNDHDLEESSVVGMLNTQGEAYTLRSIFDNVPERASVADVQYDAAVQASIDEAIQMLPSSEFVQEVAALLQESYTAGTSLTQAFVRVLHFALAESGVLLVSAASLRQRGLFGEIIAKELENIGVTEEVVAKSSAMLTEFGYHAQAQASAVNAFLHVDGKRHKINAERVSATEPRFKAGDKEYTAAELREHCAKHPENFSPAVLLRPVVQDALFPNAAYIGGPGEIAYLAQIKELYSFFGVLPTATLARHSLTILDNRTAQFLHKQGMSLDALLRTYDDLEKEVMKSAENQELAALLEQTRTAITQAYTALQPLVAAFDPTLDASTDRTKNQSLQGLDDLAGKIRKAQKRMEETTLGKLRKAHAFVYPAHVLQERSLPYLYFAAKFGHSLLAGRLYAVCKEAPTAHFVVEC
ncbi:MAG: bacillithiol biosynthesis cysteine-adding enzyme BshC [Candidatus Kapaibacterium sp.]|nr:MAG: bacillithiol biosynthesis cysteine-adding enzyme BshC [Candidatus Kapabacteria bacterium]